MKSIKTKSSLVLILLFFSIVLQAQEKDHYQQQIESIFSTLDTTGLETGLLVDVAFPFRDIKLFNGKRQQEHVLRLQDYEMAYATVETTQVREVTSIEIQYLWQLRAIRKEVADYSYTCAAISI
jgi:hypothetical protein